MSEVKGNGDEIVNYEVLSVTPDDFKRLLEKWFSFLLGKEVPHELAVKKLGDEAA